MERAPNAGEKDGGGKGKKQKTRLIKGRGRGRTCLSSSDIQLLASLLSPPSSSVIGIATPICRLPFVSAHHPGALRASKKREGLTRNTIISDSTRTDMQFASAFCVNNNSPKHLLSCRPMCRTGGRRRVLTGRVRSYAIQRVPRMHLARAHASPRSHCSRILAHPGA